MPAPDGSAAPAPQGQGSGSGAPNAGGRSGRSNAAPLSTSKPRPTPPMEEELDLDNAAAGPARTIGPHQHQPLTMPGGRVALQPRARRTKKLPSPTGGKQPDNPDLSVGSYQQNTPEDGEYAVEFVFARRWNVTEDRFEYLVKWQGYDHEHDSWGPRSNFISADGGLTLRFVEFLDANPNFDDDHHGMPHLDIGAVFQATLPFGVAVNPQGAPAWAQPEGAHHDANASLAPASSASGSVAVSSVGSAAPPYQAAPPQATSSPDKASSSAMDVDKLVIVTGTTLVSDIKANPFADVAADASVTRARAAAREAQNAERASIAQAMITPQHEPDMRVLQADAAQQLSCIQAIEEAIEDNPRCRTCQRREAPSVLRAAIRHEGN